MWLLESNTSSGHGAIAIEKEKGRIKVDKPI